MPIGLVIKWCEEKLASNKNFLTKSTKTKFDKLKERFEKFTNNPDKTSEQSVIEACNDFTSAFKIDEESSATNKIEN